MTRIGITSAFLFLIPSSARALETVREIKTVPIDLRLAVPSAVTLPTALPNLNLPDAVNLELQRIDAISPVRTASVLPLAEAPQASAKVDAPGAAHDSLAVGLEKFAGTLTKDGQTTGGAKSGALSGSYFDAMLSLPETQTIPSAEGVDRIAHEIEAPPELLRAKGIKGTVVVYGSARIPSPEAAQAIYKKTIETYGRKPKTQEGKAALKAARQALSNSKYYTLAQRFGALVAKGGGGKVAVVTGGGPGIMEAANRGAFEAGGPSVGYNIRLEHEQSINNFTTPGLSFEFENFASRKINLRHGALAMVYFPGGFGTMDEFFEVLTLMQTGKIARRPIVLVGEKSYWDQILDFQKFADMGMISQKDLELFRYAETAEAAWAIVRAQSRAAN